MMLLFCRHRSASSSAASTTALHLLDPWALAVLLPPRRLRLACGRTRALKLVMRWCRCARAPLIHPPSSALLTSAAKHLMRCCRPALAPLSRGSLWARSSLASSRRSRPLDWRRRLLATFLRCVIQLGPRFWNGFRFSASGALPPSTRSLRFRVLFRRTPSWCRFRLPRRTCRRRTAFPSLLVAVEWGWTALCVSWGASSVAAYLLIRMLTVGTGRAGNAVVARPCWTPPTHFAVLVRLAALCSALLAPLASAIGAAWDLLQVTKSLGKILIASWMERVRGELKPCRHRLA